RGLGDVYKRQEVECLPPTLEDPRSDWTRLRDALAERIGLAEILASNALIHTLPQTARQLEWHMNVFLRHGEVIGVVPVPKKPLGLAVDLGTTKIAAALLDLESGAMLASAGAPNPQISYGEDVVSRLTYVHRNPDGGQKLAQIVRQTINELLSELAQRVKALPEQVAEACIVGNTAMTHLLMGWPVRQLALAPYVAASSEPLEVFASELDIHTAPGGRVYIPPAIGGYVGSDHVAMVLASELDQSERLAIGIDIGTNTEISLRIPGKETLTAVSCASGPAFEGAHIRDGMRAASGAIEKVRLTPQGAQIATVDHEPPIGFCGSGILDAVAELYRTGYLLPNGRFDRQKLGQPEETEPRFVFVPAAQSGNGREIALTQKDINEIQLAKGAIQAGMKILLEENQIAPEEVEEVIVAGAFGSYIHIPSAIQIGLFPPLPRARYRQVGNAAAVGAQWMLISKQARQRAEAIARRTRYLELTTVSTFNRQFAFAMHFPPLGEKN
ncbi:MAG: ASKHA domain-containing protein, partial [Anaerolineales bacterium]|nr:ASKHA domain-containing protein [Anaerolineales bacterium]